MDKPNITTISFFQFKGINTLWMFPQMRLSLDGLSHVKGLKFFKLMGSGGDNGFSMILNIHTYALLAVWDTEKHARDFFESAPQFAKFIDRASEIWTVFMKNVRSHGIWDGHAPFADFYECSRHEPIAVITRATIKLKYLFKFWSYVPSVSKHLTAQKGLIFSIGIGETPLIMQATFSLWESPEAMKNFAYSSKLHTDVIKKTRELNWYKEELFANFIPYDTLGTWHGANPLASILSPKN